MTIDEAIEMLGSILKDRKPLGGGFGDESIKLGLEALKRLKRDRIRGEKYLNLVPLPGETE